MVKRMALAVLMIGVASLAGCGDAAEDADPSTAKAPSPTQAAEPTTPATTETPSTLSPGVGREATGTFTNVDPAFPSTWTVRLTQPEECVAEAESAVAYRLGRDCVELAVELTESDFAINVAASQLSSYAGYPLDTFIVSIADAGAAASGAECHGPLCLEFHGQMFFGDDYGSGSAASAALEAGGSVRLRLGSLAAPGIPVNAGDASAVAVVVTRKLSSSTPPEGVPVDSSDDYVVTFLSLNGIRVNQAMIAEFFDGYLAAHHPL